MMAQHVLKESFAIKKKIEAFFTGNKIQLSQDAKYMFCSCEYSIKIFKIFEGIVEKEIKSNDEDPIITFILSPDGNILIIAHHSGLIRQWLWKESKLERTWKSIHKGPIAQMTFDSTSTFLATGGSDSTIKVWDIVRQYCTHNLKGPHGVFSIVEFFPHTNDEKFYLFGAADDCDIHVWDLITSELDDKLIGHCNKVTCIKFSPCLKWILTGGRDKIVILWNSKTREKIRSIPVFESIESLIILPNIGEMSFLPKNTNSQDNIYNNLMVTGGEKGVLSFWNFLNGVHLFTNNQNEDKQSSENKESEDEQSNNLNSITQMFYNEHLNEIITVSVENNIIFYKLQDLSLSRQLVGNADEVLDVAFLGKNDEFLAVATNSPSIKIYNLTNYNCCILRGHSDIVLSLTTFKSDKNLLLSSSKDNSVRVWGFNPEQMTAVCYFRGFGHSHSVTAVAAPFNLKNLFVSVSEDLTMKLWKLPKKIDQSLLNISLNVGETRHVHDKCINSVVISPNDQFIATGSQDKTAKMWSIDGLNLIGVFRGHRRGIWFVQFSPVDQIIVTGSADSTIKLWELKEFTCLKTFQGHDCSVLKILFIDRGMQMISCSTDGNLKIWNLKRNECVKTIDAHNDKIWALEKSSDEKSLITGGNDSTIIIWEDVTVKEKEKVIEESETMIQKQQLLENLVQKKKWKKALKVSILLDQPFRSLTIMKEILTEKNSTHLSNILMELREDQLLTLLNYSLTWNTNSKHSLVAQVVLNSAFRTFGLENLLKIPDIKQKIESFLPYTERHLNRLSRLKQQITFVDFIWENIKLSENMGNINLQTTNNNMNDNNCLVITDNESDDSHTEPMD